MSLPASISLSCSQLFPATFCRAPEEQHWRSQTWKGLGDAQWVGEGSAPGGSRMSPAGLSRGSPPKIQVSFGGRAGRIRAAGSDTAPCSFPCPGELGPAGPSPASFSSYFQPWPWKTACFPSCSLKDVHSKPSGGFLSRHQGGAEMFLNAILEFGNSSQKTFSLKMPTRCQDTPFPPSFY